MKPEVNKNNPVVHGTSQKLFLGQFKSVLPFANDDKVYVEKTSAPAGIHGRYVRFDEMCLAIAAFLGLTYDAYDIIGDDVTTDFVITHNKGRRTMVYVVKNLTDFERIEVSIYDEPVALDTVTVKFALPPLTGEDYKVIVL